MERKYVKFSDRSLTPSQPQIPCFNWKFRNIALDTLTAAGEQPVVAGSVTARPGRYVSIPAAGLLGRGDVFEATRDTV